LSCIACHRRGLIESPDDEVRQFSSPANDARDQVRRLYPENDAFRRLLDLDRERFLGAMGELSDRFPVDTGTAEAALEELPEPVGEAARRYLLEPMTIDTVAAELSVDVDQVRAAVQSNPALQQLGLRVLLRDGGALKRAAWEAPAAFPLMKQAARQFKYDPK
ncbi:MAG: hypothetical protein AB7Q45_21590, partial [Planctomycetaceae bacterium]